jgi:hypothetical protein
LLFTTWSCSHDKSCHVMSVLIKTQALDPVEAFALKIYDQSCALPLFDFVCVDMQPVWRVDDMVSTDATPLNLAYWDVLFPQPITQV